MAPQLAIRLMVPACAKATSDDEYPFATIFTLDGNVGPGTPTVQPISGPAPPEPWEIFSAARNTSLPLSSVAQFICGACCGSGSKLPFRGLLEERQRLGPSTTTLARHQQARMIPCRPRRVSGPSHL